MEQSELVKKYTYLLGIIDNLHDFKCALSNTSRNNYFDFIKLIALDKEITENTNDQTLIDTFNNLIPVNIEEVKKVNEAEVLDIIIEKFGVNKKEIKELNEIIVLNFKKIFGENIIADNKKIIKVRQILYFLIRSFKKQNYDLAEKLFNTILLYANKKDSITFESIKQNIVNFNQNENLTYPVTFFDDMTTGLDVNMFNFHIINFDKNLIDGALTMSPQNYLLESLATNTNNLSIKSDDNQVVSSIGFTVEKGPEINALIFYKTKYYLNFDDNITCDFTDKINNESFNIKIKIKTNEISKITFIIDSINTIIHNYWDLIHTNGFDNQPIYKDNIFKHDLMSEDVIKLLILNVYKYIIQKTQFVKTETTTHNELIKIKNLCFGMVLYLFTGIKRFGDWIQMQLSKNLYFTIQTKDQICKAYGILIGAPVFHGNNEDDNEKSIIFNYSPSIDFIQHANLNFKYDKFNEIYKKFNLNKNFFYKKNCNLYGKSKISKEIKNVPIDIKPINKNDVLTLKNINGQEFLVPVRRHYFDKYIKYKNKYLKLKSKLKL